jgi:hypothetical protein
MSNQTELQRTTAEIFNLLEETFERVHGIYLDKGTSLFETLDTISAEEASVPISDRSASIAAHVKHIRFYLGVLQDHMRKREVGTVDWKEIWRTTKAVTPAEWEDLKRDLRAEYASVLGLLRSFERWDGEEEISGSLAIVVHTAYHLGAIRQALCWVKARP